MSRRKQQKPQALRDHEDHKDNSSINIINFIDIDRSNNNNHDTVGTDDNDNVDHEPISIDDHRINNDIVDDDDNTTATTAAATPYEIIRPYTDDDVTRALQQLDALSNGSTSPAEVVTSPGPVNSVANGFACCYCPNIYDTYSQLKQHEQEHADLMPYRCTFCGRGFKHKRSLDRHVKLHSGIRKYKCHFCKNAFFRSDHLKLHLKTHETSKYPFVCQICQRGYHTSVSLETHMMMHNNEETTTGDDDESCEPRFTTKELEDMIDNNNTNTNCSDIVEPETTSSSSTTKINNNNSSNLNNSKVNNSNVPNGTAEFNAKFCGTRNGPVQSLLQSLLMPSSSSTMTSSPSAAGGGTGRRNSNNDIRYGGNNDIRPMNNGGIHQPLPVTTFGKTELVDEEEEEEMGADDVRLVEADEEAEPPRVDQSEFASSSSSSYAPRRYTRFGLVGGGGTRNDGNSAPPPTSRRRSAAISCAVCAETFADVDSLQSHTLRKHSLKDLGSTKYSTNAVRINNNNNNIEDAMMLNNSSNDIGEEAEEDPTYSCDECGRSFDSILSLHNHVTSAHSNSSRDENGPTSESPKAYLCIHCNADFPTLKQYTSHMRQQHSTPFNNSNSRPNSAAVVMKSSPRSQSPSLQSITPTDAAFPLAVGLTGSTTPCSFPLAQNQQTATPTGGGAFPLVGGECCCRFCGAMFADQSTFETHSMLQHYLHKELNFKCSQCSPGSLHSGEKVFRSHEEMHKHQLDVHAAFLYRCSICKSIFESRADIQIHFNTMHSTEMTRFRCRSCNSVFPSDEQFRVHLRAAHLHINHAASCKDQESIARIKHVSNGYNVLEHSQQVRAYPAGHVIDSGLTRANPFQCPICFETFSVEYLYDKHMETLHKNNGTPVTQYTTLQHYLNKAPSIVGPANKSSLPSNQYHHHHQGGGTICGGSIHGNQHGNHGNQQNFAAKCNICDEKCANVAELAKHKLIRHCKVARSEQCSVCRDPVLNAEQFFAHTQRHASPGQPPSCVICKQSLTSLVEMQAHAKFHCEPPSPPPYQTLATSGGGGGGNHGNQENGGCRDDRFSASSLDKTNWSNPLKCQKCSVKFETSEELSDHVMKCKATTVSPNDSHRISTDQQSLASNNNNNNHSTNGGNIKRTYQCIKCQQSFTTEAEIRAHVTSHVMNDGIEHTCHLCKRIFDSPSKLQRHLIEHSYGFHCTGNNSSQQDERDESATADIVDVQNPDTVADLELTCFLCNAICSGSAALQTHLQSSHVASEKPYKCELCEQKFFFDAELENHVISTNHNNAAAASSAPTTTGLINSAHFSSPTANRMNRSSLSPPIHRAAPSPSASSPLPVHQTAFVCVLCGIAFNSASTLKCHAAQCKRKANNNLVGCSSHVTTNQLTPYGLLTPSMGGHHQVTHHHHFDPSNVGVKPATGGGKRSILAELMSRGPTSGGAGGGGLPRSSISPYRSQVADAGDPNAYHCPHCPKAFKSLSALQGHSHVHMNSIKLHRCLKCNKMFQTAAKLRNHQRQHNGDKPFSCEICGRSFSRKDNLKVHLRVHYKGVLHAEGGGPAADSRRSGSGSGSGGQYHHHSDSDHRGSGEGRRYHHPMMVTPSSTSTSTTAADLLFDGSGSSAAFGNLPTISAGMNSNLPTMVIPKLLDFYQNALDADDN